MRGFTVRRSLGALLAAAVPLFGCEMILSADFDRGRLTSPDASCTGADCGVCASGCGPACTACPPNDAEPDARAPGPRVVLLASAKGHHTCATTLAGSLACWGAGGDGRLGDNGTANVPRASFDVGLSAVTAVATGGGHSCAVTQGRLKCWGDGGYGQIGNGGLGVRVPADVDGMSAVTAVAAGEFHTCAIDSGAVKCWGRNDHGQLGIGSPGDAPTPRDVVGLGSGVLAISAGQAHTCALTSAAAVRCWGASALGDGIDASAPQEVPALTAGVAEIAAGFRHTCARTTSGEVRCWGSNASGQLGIGSPTAFVSAPTRVVGLASTPLAISAGLDHACAVLAGGSVQCWGDNSRGQLGTGDTTSSGTAVPVTMLAPEITSITAAVFHTCAATKSGTVTCWGQNGLGQLGNATTSDSPIPVNVVGFP